ncbi:MAG: hypothetical protein Ct9H300mP8_05170 [Gammaproteobacteria bacterium]|nr:MAG: hypothetical protein Ct9H300mP8_05170 [Gammaproteobacteria bacterium]
MVRGFRDVYPGDSERFDLVERSMIEVIGKYGYQEIRLPIFGIRRLVQSRVRGGHGRR